MKNLKIRAKMLIGFGSILVLIIVMNGFSLANVRHASNQAPDLFEGPHLGAVASVALVKELYQLDAGVKGMLLEKTATDSQYDEKFEDARQRAQEDIAQLDGLGALSADQAAALQSALSAIDASYAKIRQAITADELLSAKQEIEGGFATALAQAVDLAQKVSVAQNEAAQAFLDRTLHETNRNIVIQDILFVVIVLAAVATALKMAIDISLPVRRAAQGMNEVAKGNFDFRVENDSGDEIGILTRQMGETMDNLKRYIFDIRHVLGEVSRGNIALSVDREYIGDFSEIKDSLNLIIDSLNATMNKIRTCCDLVRAGATGLAAGSQSLAQGSAEQTTAVENFQNMLGRVAELTRHDSENAERVMHISDAAREAVGESDRQMKEMTRAMSEIDESSQEIAKIIKLIEDIAFQTNILALNAAVEAARAGAAGKGFAVVADEVRNLANKSQEAASNTTAMIGKAVSAVGNGTRIVDATAQSLQNVDVNVSSIASILEEIGESTAEQAEAFDEMTVSVEQISAVVHANSAAAEENSSASDELSAQAAALDELVGAFRLREGAAAQS